MLVAECTPTGPTGWSCLVDMTLLTSPHADPPEDHSLPHFTKYKGRTSDHHFVWQSFSCLKLTCRLYVYAAKKSRHRKQRDDHNETTRPQRWLLMVTAAGDRVLYATGHMTDGADSMPGPRHDNRRKSTFSTSCRMQGRCVRLPAKRPVRASAAARRPTKMERERRSHEDEPGAVPPSSVR